MLKKNINYERWGFNCYLTTDVNYWILWKSLKIGKTKNIEFMKYIVSFSNLFHFSNFSVFYVVFFRFLFTFFKNFIPNQHRANQTLLHKECNCKKIACSQTALWLDTLQTRPEIKHMTLIFCAKPVFRWIVFVMINCVINERGDVCKLRNNLMKYWLLMRMKRKEIYTATRASKLTA